MEEIDDPVEMCRMWTEHAAPIISPASLTIISVKKIKHMIRRFSLETEENSKLLLRIGLKNLFDIPGQFVSEFLETLLQSIQNYQERGSNNVYPITDKFLLSQLLHPAVSHLDMERVPVTMRNILIRNISKMNNLLHQSLTLALSITMPWSTFFSPSLTIRFVGAIEKLQILTFSNFADNAFLSAVGQTCFSLAKLDVQGSIEVTDVGLSSLSDLIKLKYLDVNRTGVTVSSLVTFVMKMPGLTSLGTWEDFSPFDQSTLQQFTELNLINIFMENVAFSQLSNLTKLQLKMTNSSQELLFILKGLRNIQCLSLADVNYGHSGLGRVLKGLSSKIKILHLDHVYGWDTDNLRTMGESCQTLDATILHNSESDKKVRYFPNLSKLIISSNITHSQFLVLTGHALNLTFLQTGVTCWITTRLLSHLVKLNSLSQLKYLRMDYTKDLSANVLFLLLKKASNLQIIVGAETWPGLNKSICEEMNSLFEVRNLCHNLKFYDEKLVP